MRRRLMCIVLMAAVLSGNVLQAQAAEWRGSIHVTLEYGQEPIQGSVTLYRVGEETPDGYRLLESFGGGMIRQEDGQSPALAQWLAESAGDGGEARILDADGTACYTDLEQGLYLLMQPQPPEGYLAVSPFLIPVPYDGLWNMTAYPKTQRVVTESPKTGQHPAPIIGAMGMVLAGMGILMCMEKFRRK